MKTTVYMITTVFYPSIGGVENHVYNLSYELVQKGYNVKIINPVINLGTSSVYNMDGIEIHKISIGNKYDELKYLKYKSNSKDNILGYINGYKRKFYYNKFCNNLYDYIEKDIKDNNVEKVIIHQHDFISSIKLSKKLSKKYNVIFTNHTGEFLFLKKLPLSNLIIKFLTKHFKYIIAPSNELAAFDSIRNIDTYKYIPNGVNVNKFKVEDENAISMYKVKHKIPHDKMIVFCPRRWAPTKGVIYLVKAIDIIVNEWKINDFIFMFAGDAYQDYPEYRNKIIEMIEEKQLKNRIILKGNVEYSLMNELMKSSDIVVFPSLMEAVSLAALEAMSCGKVVIATNIGGFPQIINDKRNGFLVPERDEMAIAAKLKELISNKEKLNEISKNSSDFVKENYSWTRICEEVEEIYIKYLNCLK